MARSAIHCLRSNQNSTANPAPMTVKPTFSAQGNVELVPAMMMLPAAKLVFAIASTANRIVRARAFLICRRRSDSSCRHNSMIASVVMPQPVYRALLQTQPNHGQKPAHRHAAGPLFIQ